MAFEALKQDLEKLAQKYLQNGYQDKATIEHSKNIDGKVTVVESWVSKSSTKDKSALYFNRAFPIGTWFITMKVNDDNLWQNYVKTGIVKAISIEGLFAHNLVKQSMWEKSISELTENEAEVFLGKIRAIISKDSRYKGKKRVDMESYSDYPQSVKNAAKSALDWVDKNGWGSCGTPVGKQRANQLSKGEPISVDTIKRMYSYVSRHEIDLETSKSFGDGCGFLMMQSWGGLGAGRWAKSKLKELGILEENEAQPSVTSTYPGEAAEKKKKEKMEIEAPNINVFGYHTRYFAICPGAQSLFEHLITMPVDEDTKGMIRSAAQIADNVFRKEEEVIESGVASQHDYEEAVLLVDDFKDLMGEIDEEVGMVHDVSFMDGHIERIKNYK
jgi:hypothetical protein